MFTVCQDVFTQVVSFLDGPSRRKLAQTSKQNLSLKQLSYDGPPLISRRYLISFLPERYAKVGKRTKNGFLYCTCPKTAVSKNHLADARKLASDFNTPLGTFVCFWRHFGKQLEPGVDVVLRDAAETMKSTASDAQTQKVLFLVEESSPERSTLQQVLHFACLNCNLTVINYLLEVQSCELSAQSLVLALVSNACTPEQRVEVVDTLLKQSSAHLVMDLDAWSLKYALYNDDWQLFTLLYSYILDSTSPTEVLKLERDICRCLPESARDSVYAEITSYRNSLLPASLLYSSV